MERVSQGAVLKSARAKKEKVVKDLVNIHNIDYTVFLVTFILVLLGVVMVLSASYYTASREPYNDMYTFFRKQAVAALMGMCAMLFMSTFNYRYLKGLAFMVYAVANALLILVLFIGATVKGATRWIVIPGVIQFQPSEIAKVGIILFLSLIISSRKDILKNWSGFFLCTAIVGVSALLVFLGKNMSTTLIVMAIGMSIIFVASPYTLRFIVAGASAVSGLALYLFKFSTDFRGERVTTWLNPFENPTDEGFQIINSLYAIASGGAFGLGIGQSRQKTFTPEIHNDFIFSIICEELGFVGALIVLVLFGVLIWRALKIAISAQDTFGALLATGIATMIGLQVIINIAVVTNAIPNTGVPLPFISYGGTSLVVMMGMIGVLLNISRHEKRSE